MEDNSTKPEIQPILMTVEQTAKYLNISRSATYRLINEQGLPVYRLGGSVRTRKEDIETWLQQQKSE
jgi:excisionase family DNA binding protein